MEGAKLFTPRRAAMLQQSSSIACHSAFALLDFGKYPPAEPGALGIGPLEAAVRVAKATLHFVGHPKVADQRHKFICSKRLSSCSCFLMYSRITASSRPTVETKYPLAQKCCPTKLRFFSPYTRAKWIALLPLINPTTCETAYFGGIEIIM